MKVALVLAVTLAACANDDRQPPATTLPAGIYDVSGPTCLSTGQSPAYPSASYKLALLDLDGLTQHTLDVGAVSAVETLSDADCTMTITRSIYRNYGGDFILRGDRKHTFSPGGCALAVTVDEHAYPVSPEFSNALADSSARDAEVPFVAAQPAPGTYELTSADRTDYDAAWAAFGCQASDRISFLYKSR